MVLRKKIACANKRYFITMTRYFLIIITITDEPEEAPFVYFIEESEVTPKMLEEMKYQTGGYPFWCMPSDDLDDPPSLCDIESVGIEACSVCGKFHHRAVTRCFHYVV